MNIFLVIIAEEHDCGVDDSALVWNTDLLAWGGKKIADDS